MHKESMQSKFSYNARDATLRGRIGAAACRRERLARHLRESLSCHSSGTA